jgi:hypothetical protein
MDEASREIAPCGIAGCTQPASAGEACLRCGRLLCVYHTPGDRELCSDCESSFTIGNTRTAGWSLVFWLPFLVPWVVYLCFAPELARMRWTVAPRWSFSVHPLFDFAWISGLIGVLLGLLGRRIRKSILRRRFLRGA